jgi:DNA-binding protein H-NS
MVRGCVKGASLQFFVTEDTTQIFAVPIMTFFVVSNRAMGTLGRSARDGVPWGQREALSMISNDFDSMSTDELWSVHEQVTSTLARKITEEKSKLEQRLRLLENSGLESSGNAIGPDRPRRPYPKVLPKYQNPKNPAEKWSGRGKQPHWVQRQLKAGKKLERFLIAR